MKRLIKKLVPEGAVLAYHYIVAVLASLVYRLPSRKMIVIGVTGTKGKTSAINFIWSVLTNGGYKTGIISTANIRIGEREVLNKYHMTMPGRFTIQKLLSEMVKAGCKYCLVETTSEGLKQYRHIGVYYDFAVFMNLSPEHLESHGGSFARYKEAKGKMFKALTSHRKILDGKKVEKVIIANKDNEYADYFLQFPADKKIIFGLKSGGDYRATDIVKEKNEIEFKAGGHEFELNIPGRFNIYNALPAIIVGHLAGINNELIADGLEQLRVIPGRMERIDAGQDFMVIVDYAHEKESITNVLETANKIKDEDNKVVILLGAEGGGRDRAKRPVMGELTGKRADYVVVSNVDPYDDDPNEILEDIALAAEQAGKVRNENLFVIEDRREGISKALTLASSGDVVLITGKGAEQSMIVGKQRIAWDDRMVVKEELLKLKV
ncbi:UDP-N-acetylmuramoyl-L-alanyl-D-glutamate--2,6-diaminopimelate ligase [Patescibacteria group bacterium]|nr:UDP-N-acetylmuramoyl-L-alanyl-D-glutamate--2,6-diaminopimelate ligase [Patescibacteria group bacterium]